MRPENGAAREQGGPSAEKPDGVQSRAANNSLADQHCTFDGAREAFPPPREIVFTDADAERVVRFIAACRERR